MHILRYVNYSSNHALISIFSVCGCGTIKVTLSKKAQTTITLPNLQGLYEESATVNGRSSWISTNKLYAIWYHPDFKDWMMGLSKEIGTRWLVHFSLASLNLFMLSCTLFWDVILGWYHKILGWKFIIIYFFNWKTEKKPVLDQ